MKKLFILLLCFLLVLPPVFAQGSKEEIGKDIGGFLGLNGGVAAGTYLGGAIGTLIYPGVGTVAGLAIGAVSGGFGGKICGESVGKAIGQLLTYNGTEFIHVNTKFDMVQLGEERIENIIYKTDSNSQIDLFTNDFIYGNPVDIHIKMTPEIIDENADIPNTGLNIPVFFFIEPTESISYEHVGGIADLQEQVNDEGIKYLTTVINTKIPESEIVFRFKANAPGEAKITVIFGSPYEDRLIVNQSSNQIITIRFIEY